MKDLDIRDEVMSHVTRIVRRMHDSLMHTCKELDKEYDLTSNEFANIYTNVSGNFSALCAIMLSDMQTLDLNGKIKLRNKILLQITNTTLEAAKDMEENYGTIEY